MVNLTGFVVLQRVSIHWRITNVSRKGRESIVAPNEKSFGGCGDRRLRHTIWNMQKQRANDRSNQTEQCEPIKSARVAAGQIFHGADIPGPEETSEIAERVDPGDACCQPGAAEKHRRHRKERALGAVKAHR